MDKIFVAQITVFGIPSAFTSPRTLSVCVNSNRRQGSKAKPKNHLANSTNVRVRSFESYTLTWICGYFFLSSKPAFIAVAEVS